MYYYLRIQGVLRVNEDYFPTRVAILAWQLSSDWKRSSFIQHQQHQQCCVKRQCSSLLTHHRMCGTAEFSRYGILMLRIMLAALFKSGR